MKAGRSRRSTRKQLGMLILVAVGLAVAALVGFPAAAEAAGGPPPPPTTTGASSTSTSVPSLDSPSSGSNPALFGLIGRPTNIQDCVDKKLSSEVLGPCYWYGQTVGHNTAGGVGSILLPSDGLPSSVPSDSHYDIGYSTGGSDALGLPNDPAAIITGTLTNWIFVGGRWITHAGLSLINWAFDFTIAGALSRPAEKIASSFQANVVGPLGLVGLDLFVCAVWAGWHILRSRLSRGVGEFAVSLVILAVTTAAWAAPASFLLGPSGLLGQTRALSLDVASVVVQGTDALNTQTPPPSAADPAGPLLESLHHAFIEVPYQLLNWGQQLDTVPAEHNCYLASQVILAHGPWGSSDTPRGLMNQAGCQSLAKFNAAPTPDRLIAAGLIMLGSFIIMMLAIAVAFGLMMAELAIVGCVAWFPLAAAAGLLPGAGRQLLWRWCTHALNGLAAVLATVIALAVLLVAITGILAATQGDALLLVFAMLDAMVVAGIIWRRRLLKGMQRSVKRFGERLEHARIGGAHGARLLAPAAAGFATAELLDEHRRLRHQVAQGQDAVYRARRLSSRLNGGTRPELAAGSRKLPPGGGTGPGRRSPLGRRPGAARPGFVDAPSRPAGTSAPDGGRPAQRRSAKRAARAVATVTAAAASGGTSTAAQAAVGAQKAKTASRVARAGKTAGRAAAKRAAARRPQQQGATMPTASGGAPAKERGAQPLRQMPPPPATEPPDSDNPPLHADGGAAAQLGAKLESRRR